MQGPLWHSCPAGAGAERGSCSIPAGGSRSLDLLPSLSSAAMQRQRWPRVSGNASCSSILAPKNCCRLSRSERGSCCSSAGSSLEFVPSETPTFLEERLGFQMYNCFCTLVTKQLRLFNLISSLQSYLSFPTFCGIHKLYHHH